MAKGLRKFNQQIILAMLLLIVLVVTGTAGYVWLEAYSIADALYMTVITITTVGFGEVKPLSPFGRVFTSVLILFGFASLAFAGHAMMETLFNKLLSMKSEKKKMEKKISQLKDHYVICGFGRVGASALERFTKAGVQSVMVEASHENYQSLLEKNYACVEGNAIEEETLISAGIKKAKGLLAILPSDPDNLFITLTARELNPRLHIIARAQNATSEKKLLQAGADSVISPYTAAGRQIANKMLAAAGADPQPEMDENQMICSSLRWFEVEDGKSMVGSSIGQVAAKMNIKICGLRTSSGDHLEPSDHWTLQTGDRLLTLSTSTTEVLKEANKPKRQRVLVVEDDPSTLRLYMRLLHRAGFMVMSADNGPEALDLIVKEKPDAAVVDLTIPILTGIEVCERVRKERTCDNVKLILFTGDDDPETKVRALQAGANEVVIKCTEAAKLVNTIGVLLKESNFVQRPTSAHQRCVPDVKVVDEKSEIFEKNSS